MFRSLVSRPCTQELGNSSWYSRAWQYTQVCDLLKSLELGNSSLYPQELGRLDLPFIHRNLVDLLFTLRSLVTRPCTHRILVNLSFLHKSLADLLFTMKARDLYLISDLACKFLNLTCLLLNFLTLLTELTCWWSDCVCLRFNFSVPNFILILIYLTRQFLD